MRWVELVPLELPGVGAWGRHGLTCLEEYFADWGPRVPASGFIHALVESGSVFTIDRGLLLSALSGMLRFYWDTRYFSLIYYEYSLFLTT